MKQHGLDLKRRRLANFSHFFVTQVVKICGPLINEELACAPGWLLAYLAKLLELALVLANSVPWDRS